MIERLPTFLLHCTIECRTAKAAHPLPFSWAAGSNYYVRILSTLNRELLKPSSSVALHRHSNALVDILPPEADSSISLLSDAEKPDVSYSVSILASHQHLIENNLLAPLL